MVDKRLIGTWRSDRAKTLKEIRLGRDISKSKLSFYNKILGKLTHRFTRTRFIMNGIGEEESRIYRVVAIDLGSVAITVNGKGKHRPHIVHIHFEGERYWIPIGSGRFRE